MFYLKNIIFTVLWPFARTWITLLQNTILSLLYLIFVCINIFTLSTYIIHVINISFLKWKICLCFSSSPINNKFSSIYIDDGSLFVLRGNPLREKCTHSPSLSWIDGFTSQWGCFISASKPKLSNLNSLLCCNFSNFIL